MATRTVVKYRTRVIGKRARHKAKMTIPLAAIAGFAPLLMDVVNGARFSGINGAATALQRDLLAYDPEAGSMNPYWAIRRGWGPILAGLAVHKLIGSKLGVNRMLAGAGVPFVRL